MAKKQKVKKINNGRHNNTQINRQYNGQETKRQKDKQKTTQKYADKQTNLFVFLFLGHYIVCLSMYYCVDRCLSFCLFVSWPLYCLFVCVLLCQQLFIFLTFYFLAIILSVYLCIFVSTVVYLFDLLFLGHYIVCLSVYYCVDRCLSFHLCVSWPLYCLFVCILLCRPLFIFLTFCFLAIILCYRQYNGQEAKR
jgi:hypothetical protein